MRNYLRWFLVVMFGLLAGSAYVQYLTTNPLQIGLEKGAVAFLDYNSVLVLASQI